MKLIKGGKIYTITSGIIEKGDILIDGMKIKKIGKTIKSSSGCEIIDAEGKLVFPGFIDAHAHTGVFNEGVGYAKSDDGNECTDPVTPECRAIDAINFLDAAFPYLLAGGVTTIMTGPGSGNIICGQSAVIKTFGKSIDEMLVNPYAGMKMALGENPISVYREQKRMPSTRMGNAAVMRKALTEAQNYMEKLEAYNKNKKKDKGPFERNLKHEALIPVLKRKVPARIHCHRADDILTAIRIADEFKLKICIEHCTEGYKVADKIAKKKIPVIVGPHLCTPHKWEMKDQSLKNAVILHEAGVKVAIQTDDMRLVQYLALNAGLVAREGWPEEEALKAITITPAEILGLDKELGSITEGKNADLSIFDRHPFDARARAEKVMIGGKVVLSV